MLVEAHAPTVRDAQCPVPGILSKPPYDLLGASAVAPVRRRLVSFFDPPNIPCVMLSLLHLSQQFLDNGNQSFREGTIFFIALLPHGSGIVNGVGKGFIAQNRIQFGGGCPN